MDVERFVDAGDRVAVIATMLGRGSGSGVEVENRHGSVWTIRDGKAVRFEWFSEPDEAFEAVGLRRVARTLALDDSDSGETPLAHDAAASLASGAAKRVVSY